MKRIAFVNMPFAMLEIPSIGLTQLKSVLDRQFAGKLSTELLYLNHDFGRYLGVSQYQDISVSMTSHNSGLGDWLFRQVAFESESDNTLEYLQRYYFYADDSTATLKALIQEKREGLADFLDELIERYRLDEADVVGFTSMFMQNVASIAMAKRIKLRSPDVLILMGGANCEYPLGKAIADNVDPIDCVFSGPALISLPKFIRRLMDGETDLLAEICGLFPGKRFARGNGKQAMMPILAELHERSTLGEELDINAEIPLDYDAFLDDMERYFKDEVEPILTFETSRGCWWGQKAHCTFCGLNGTTMAYRAMKPENALRLFNSLLAYADRCSRFNCVDNIMPTEYLKEVFPFVTPPPHVTLFYEVKADLSEEDVAVLARAGVKSIQPGIEALATSTLKLMKKGTSAFQNISLLKNCALYGVVPEWNLLVGFPGEGEEVYKKYVEDMPLLTHLQPPNGVFPVRFDRYSPYFVQAKQYGLDLHPVDFYSLIYPFSGDVLNDLAYYFADHNLDASDYYFSMIKWIGQVRERAEEWKLRHEQGAEGLPPKLYLRTSGDLATIYDSRGKQAKEHRLGEITLGVLASLKKPRRLRDLELEFRDTRGFDAAYHINTLKELGLVFHENERYISLVLPRDPQPAAE